MTDPLDELAARRFHERFMRELEGNRFLLVFQSIATLSGSPGAGYREILVRYKEEERDVMQTPGTFLGVLDDHGLMPELDRWIVSRVVKWVVEREPLPAPLCGINLSAATLREEFAFAGHVRDAVRGKPAVAAALTFEVSVEDLRAHGKELARLMPALRSCGCTFALNNYPGDDRSFDLARSLGFAIVKFDGALVYGVSSRPEARERLQALARRCREYGMRTVAMQVEDDQTLATLKGLDVDYAQGFGIDRPHKLESGPSATSGP